MKLPKLPNISSQPRYDHFDTSPRCIFKALRISVRLRAECRNRRTKRRKTVDIQLLKSVDNPEKPEISRVFGDGPSTDLLDFECGPFNHLGTSPYTQTVYNNRRGMSRGKRPAGSFPVPAEAGTKAGPFEAGEKQAKTQNKIGKKGGETLLFSDTLLTHFYAIFGRFWPYLRDP